jgi:hypothetical protein
MVDEYRPEQPAPEPPLPQAAAPLPAGAIGPVGPPRPSRRTWTLWAGIGALGLVGTVAVGLVIALNSSGPASPGPSGSATAAKAASAPPPQRCTRDGDQVTDPEGRRFDTWSCPTAQQGPLFLEPAPGTTTGYLRSSTNWFACQKEGAANPQGNATTWLYTQGDDRYRNDGWGWYPASSVSETWQDTPVPDIPTCPF